MHLLCVLHTGRRDYSIPPLPTNYLSGGRGGGAQLCFGNISINHFVIYTHAATFWTTLIWSEGLLYK